MVQDGDGRTVKRVETYPAATFQTYYLRSSVLDGRIVAELNQSGQKQKGYVFAGGQLLAVQEFGSVLWQHVDPITGSTGESRQTGTFTRTAELDP